MLDPCLISYLNDPNFPLLMQKNNPGNIQSTTHAFPGQLDFSITEKPAVCTFIKYHYGIDALLKIINYRYNILGFNTLSKMLNNWTKNTNTNKALISTVSKGIGINPQATFEWTSSDIHLLTQEICRYNIKQNPRINSELFGFLWLKI